MSPPEKIAAESDNASSVWETGRLAEQALGRAGICVFHWDPVSDQLTWSPNAASVLDDRGGNATTLEDFTDCIVARDRVRFREAVRNHTAHRAPLQVQVSLGSDAESSLVSITGQADWDAEGKAASMAFCLQRKDPDASNLHEARASESEVRLRMLIDHAPMCIHEIDLGGRITSMNRAGLQMMGLANESQICGVKYLDCTCDADRSRIAELMQRAINGEYVDFEFSTDDPDAPRVFSSCFVPIRNEHGYVSKLMGLTTDVTDQRRIETQRNESEERYRLARRAAGIGVWEWDLETNHVFVTDEMRSLLSLPSDKASFHIDTITGRIAPEHVRDWRESVRLCLEQEREHRIEFRTLTPDGAIRWISTYADARRDAKGEATHLVGVMMEVSDRKRGEIALRESEERFQLAVIGSTDGIWDWNIETGHVFYSVRYKQLLGYSPSDSFSADLDGFTSTLHPDDLDATWGAVNHHLDTHEPYDREFRMRTKLGEYRWFRARGQAVWTSDGTPLRMAGSIQDITAKREAERLLREVINLVPHQIFAKDQTGRFVLSNRKHAEDLGLTPDEVVGRTQLDLTPDASQAEAFLADDHQVITDGQPKLIPEEMYTTPDGRQVTLQTHKIPLDLPTQSARTIQGVLGVSIDITNLKQAEERLRQREEQYRSLVETTTDWVWEMDVKGFHTYSNQQILEILGYSETEFSRIQVYDLLHKDERQRVQAMVQEAITEQKGWRNFVVRMRAKSGEYRYLESNAAPVIGGNGKLVGFRGIDRDITDRKLAAEELANARLLLNAAIESSPPGILIVDPTGEVLMDNAAARRMSGDESQLIQGRSLDAYFESLRCFNPDGSEIARAEQPLAKSLKGETSRNVDMRVRRPNGEVRWLLVNAAPVRDASGAMIAGVAVFLDVTDLKDAEREREKLIRELEEKNTELEQFTYTVSHDLKSPVITIKGFLGLLERDITKQDWQLAESRIFRIRRASDQMSQLLDELLQLSRIGRVANARQPVSLTELAEEAVILVGGALESRQATVDVQSNLPVVLVDRKRFVEVFQNLIDNACRFLGDADPPSIRVGMRVDDGESVFFVKDNGIGVAPEYREKVFGLFEQLDPESGGTGIGLAIVKRIIEVHGGRIWMESDGLGKGTTACFTVGAVQT